MQEIRHTPRILVVEDDAAQRELVCEALAIHYDDHSGRNIVGTATAGECLAQDLARFDVILQNYNLPDMPGVELLDCIKARTDIPVLFVTSENVSAKAAEAMQHGAEDYIVKLGDYLFALPTLVDKNIRQHHIKEENQRLQLQLQAMLQELRNKNAQLENSLERLRAMATTDHLTDLANRRYFAEILDRYFSEAVRYGFDLTCCMCDLDHYKKLNDSLGHLVGDEILVMAAEVIRASLRGTDVAARYGGDEFVLLLPHTSVSQGLAVADRIRGELLARSRAHPKLGQALTMSMGVASLDVDRPTSADALLAMADRSLYAAKDRGRDQIIAYSEIGHHIELPA